MSGRRVDCAAGVYLRTNRHARNENSAEDRPDDKEMQKDAASENALSSRYVDSAVFVRDSRMLKEVLSIALSNTANELQKTAQAISLMRPKYGIFRPVLLAIALRRFSESF